MAVQNKLINFLAHLYVLKMLRIKVFLITKKNVRKRGTLTEIDKGNTNGQ